MILEMQLQLDLVQVKEATDVGELGFTGNCPFPWQRHGKLHLRTPVSVLMETPGTYDLSQQTGPHQPNKGWLYMDIRQVIKK